MGGVTRGDHRLLMRGTHRLLQRVALPSLLQGLTFFLQQCFLPSRDARWVTAQAKTGSHGLGNLLQPSQLNAGTPPGAIFLQLRVAAC